MGKDSGIVGHTYRAPHKLDKITNSIEWTASTMDMTAHDEATPADVRAEAAALSMKLREMAAPILARIKADSVVVPGSADEIASTQVPAPVGT